MIHKLRVPTPEPFSFIEFEFEGTPEGAVDEYRRLTEAVKPQKGMESGDFNAILDDYLTNNKIVGDPGMFERMSVEQVAIIQAIKRSRARTK